MTAKIKPENPTHLSPLECIAWLQQRGIPTSPLRFRQMMRDGRIPYVVLGEDRPGAWRRVPIAALEALLTPKCTPADARLSAA